MMIEDVLRLVRRETGDDKNLRRWFHLAHCVDVTNVHEFILQLGEKEWNYGTDLPCMVSPWPWTWMEYKRSIITDSSISSWANTLGAMVQQQRYVPSLSDPHKIFDAIYSLMEASTVNPQEQMREVEEMSLDGVELGWSLVFDLFAKGDAGINHLGMMFSFLRSDGVPWEQRFILGRGADGEHAKGIEVLLFPILYSLGLLNCKNTRLVERKIGRHQARHLEKTGITVSLKELRVKPLRLKSVYGYAEPGNGSRKRGHICRGFFRDYRAGKGLFGKYHGIFWSPPHLRGDLGQGMVLKDYKVDPSWN